MSENSKQSVAAIIAGKFIQELEKGVAPWARGFQVVAPRNAVSKKTYRGINALLLSILGVDYACTFKQAQAMGGSVKKGSKGFPVVFWNFVDKKGTGDADAGVPAEKVAFMRYYTVFPMACVGGADFKPLEVKQNGDAKIDSAEGLFEAIKKVCGFEVLQGGNQPCFTPACNTISMPTFNAGESATRYYKTLFHECGHALGLVTGKTFSFSGEGYATEELVAELFAASCLSILGVSTPEAWDNSVAYVQGWVKKLTDEPQAIISAAQECQKRLDLIFGPSEDSESAE